MGALDLTNARRMCGQIELAGLCVAYLGSVGALVAGVLITEDCVQGPLIRLSDPGRLPQILDAAQQRHWNAGAYWMADVHGCAVTWTEAAAT